MKKSVFVLIFLTQILLKAQCPAFTDSKINFSFNTKYACLNDTITLTSSASNLLSIDSVKYYWDTNKTYNPYNNQGNFLGAAKIRSFISNTPCSICPQIQAVFINSCNGSGDEWDNEFLLFNSGSGITANNLQIKYHINNETPIASNGSINIAPSTCSVQTPTAKLMDSILGCSSLNKIAVTPSTVIPPNSQVVFFTSSNISKAYNFSAICNSGITLYVMQSSCQRIGGAFTNNANSSSVDSTILSLSNCPSCRSVLKYSRAGLSDVDGEFAVMSSTGISSKANGSIKVNSTDPCSGPLSTFSTVPFYIDTIKVALNNPLMCGYDTLFLKSIFKVHPNSALCPNSNPISYGDTMRVILSCPVAKITGKVSICAGEKDTLIASNLTPKPASNNSYSWNNGNNTSSQIVTTAGCYKVTLSQNGCISKDSICVSVGTSPAITIKNALDSCFSVTYKSTTYYNDSTIVDTIKSASGICDSLYIKQPIHILKNDTTNISSCFTSSSTYNFYGTILNSPGTYYHVFNKTNKCDSIIKLILYQTQLLPDTTIFTCQNTTVYKSKTYNTTTTFFDTTKSVSNNVCDSIVRKVTLNINNLNPTRNTNPVLDSCISIWYKGKQYTSSTTIIDTIRTSRNCDSVITTQQIIINTNKSRTINTCIVSGSSYWFYGTSYNAPGIYTKTINNSNKCDSNITLNLQVILPNNFNKPKIIACQSYTYKGVTYTTSTNLRDTIKSLGGCDSIYQNTPLEIYTTTVMPEIKIVGCDSILFNGSVYYDSTTKQKITKSLLNPSCDSVVQPYFLLVNKKPSISIATSPQAPFSKYDKIILTAIGKGHFLWNNGDTNKILQIVLTTNSNYIVTITDSNSCINEASVLLKVENNEVFLPNAFTPNFDGNNDVFMPNFDPPVEIKSMSIFNRWGEKLYEGTGNAVAWDGKYKGEMQPSGVYVYTLEYISNGKIKVLKGSLSLIL